MISGVVLTVRTVNRGITIETSRREFSAREFNRDPSAVARAARRWGSVRILNRGVPSLVLVDATQYPDLVPSRETSLLDALSMPGPWDEDILGEPPRADIALRPVEP